MAKKIVAARDLPAGHVLTRDDLVVKSPTDDGLPPYQLSSSSSASCAARVSSRRSPPRTSSGSCSPSPRARRDHSLRDPARRLRLRRLLGQPRVDERRGEEASPASAATPQAAAAGRGRRRVLRPHVGDERRCPCARQEYRIECVRGSRTSSRCCTTSSSGGLLARRPAYSRQRHQRCRVSGRGRAGRGPGRRLGRGRAARGIVLSRAEGHGACVSSATRSGGEAAAAEHERSALRSGGSHRDRHGGMDSSGQVYLAGLAERGMRVASFDIEDGAVPDGAGAFRVDVTDRTSIERALDEVVAGVGRSPSSSTTRPSTLRRRPGRGGRAIRGYRRRRSTR